jgi:glucose-1-phosphate cytidylyltransferase
MGRAAPPHASGVIALTLLRAHLQIPPPSMKVVILCGGKGTRLREETEYRPKPMLPIGDRPILWHIMKTYAHYGHKEFILCLGYKGELIKDYFRNYLWHTGDTTLTLGRNPGVRFHDTHGEEDWKVTLADTGQDSMTAYRIRCIRKHLGEDENFLLTYGDGVGDIPINACIDQHKRSGKVCTLTAVRPPGRFGELRLEGNDSVHGFNEKPQTEGGYINGGYMVCSRRIFDFIPDDPKLMFEQAPMKSMTEAGELGAFKHDGFWQPMDTYHEFTLLNDAWATGRAPWQVWNDAHGLR